MTRKTITAGAYVAAAVLSIAVAPRSLGQAAPAATPAAAPATEEEVVVLSPFVVTAAEDRGYAATSTLAGTRIRTDLKDVGSSISVVTESFLRDTGSKNAEQLLVYTPSTEVAGQGGNFLGQGDGQFVTASALTAPVSNSRVRGLAEADNTRDFYLSDIPWDSYNVGRVDLQRGPNSVLFGIGSPAGIVNSSLNTASFQTAYKVENQLGSFGTLRFSGDFNQVLLKEELALRLSLLDDSTKFKQDPAFRDDKRIFAAMRWDPAFMNKGAAKTSLRINYEAGNIDSNMPRYTPPIDTYTQWFNTTLNQATYDGRTLNNGVPNAYIGPIGNRVYDGVATAFVNGVQDFSYPTSMRITPTSSGSNISALAAVGTNGLKGIATTDLYAKQANLLGAASGLWKATSLTNTAVFDFYNNLIEGPNKSEFNNFHAINAALSQTFFNNKLGFEIAYDAQDAKWGSDTSMANDGTTVTVDINAILLNGAPNPKVGQAMVVMGGGTAGVYRETRSRDVVRATAFGELNFAELVGKDSLVTKIFGRNVFTGLLSRQADKDMNAKGPRWYLPYSYVPNQDKGNVSQASRDNIMLGYIGAATMDLGFKGLKEKIHATTSTINVWDNTRLDYFDFALPVYDSTDYNDSDRTYTQGFKSKNVIDSQAVIWQGYWFDGCIVPMVGIRQDKLAHRGATTPGFPKLANGNNDPQYAGMVNINEATWLLPTDSVNPSNNPKGLTYLNSTGTSRTFSLVTHLPKSWRKALPGNMDISLFANQSENFKPEARRDLFGAPLPSATGKTKEFGFAITALDEKLVLKVVRYDTKVKGASINGALGGAYLIGANEWWGGNAARAQRDNNSWQRGNYGTSTSGHVLTVQPDINPANSTYDAHLASVLTAANTPLIIGTNAGGQPIYSQLAIDTAWTDLSASIADYFAKLAPPDLQSAWEMVQTSDGVNNKDGNYNPSGMNLTSDTASKGWEFELTANPISGLDVSFNASKTSAQRSNLAATYTTWILRRWTDLQGPMGDIRIWGGGANGETMRSKFGNETYAGWLFFNAVEGSDVPELRPWRFNIVTNYSFKTGALKGANVGTSLRWQDKNVIGFLAKQQLDPISGRTIYVSDLTQPISGKGETSVDLWCGYERKLTERLNWRIQLNVRNVFASKDLLPTTTQADGSTATYRIPEPRTWSLTNTFSF